MNREPILIEKIIQGNAMRGIDWIIVFFAGLFLAMATHLIFSLRVNHLMALGFIGLIFLIFAHLRFWGYRKNVSGVTINLTKNFIIYVSVIAVFTLGAYMEHGFVLPALTAGWGGLIYFNMAALLAEPQRGTKNTGYALTGTLKMTGALSVIWIAGLIIIDYIYKLG